MWLRAVLIVPREAPFTAISWNRIGRKNSPMMLRPAVGSR